MGSESLIWMKRQNGNGGFAMKKNLLMVLGMVMLMMLSVASADSGNAATLPDGIKQILNGSVVV